MNNDPYRVVACRSCNAPVRWVSTALGKRMPIDAVPTDAGTIVVDAGVATVVAPEDLFDTRQPRYTSHFATCPQAAEWRKGKRGSRR